MRAPVLALPLMLIAGLAQAQGVCRFDEIVARLPAGDTISWRDPPYETPDGHFDEAVEEPFAFTAIQFAMHSGGVRMDAPKIDGVSPYTGMSREYDFRFEWNGHVFALPIPKIETADGRRVLMVRRADKPVVDLWLGTCGDGDGSFDRDAFADEWSAAPKGGR